MTRITQSMLGNADKCLLSFQYGLDTPVWFKRTAGADRAVGTAFHAALELYYRERINVPELLPDTAAMIVEGFRSFDLARTLDSYDNTPVEIFKWSERIPDEAEAYGLISALVTAYVENHWYWPPEFTVVEVEANHTVTHPDTGHRFKLGADLVLRDPNGWIVLDDHKTAGKAWAEGKHHPRKQNQASLYTWAARQIWPDAPGVRFVFDIIQFPGKKTEVRFERRISDPTPAHEAAIVKKAIDLVDLYEVVHVQMGRDLPANPASTLCNPKWCDYFDGCPHGALLDT